jgi:hypothetical protein
MTRLKWFELLTNVQLPDISIALQERRFRRHGSSCGFELIEVSSAEVSARFIQEEKLTETVVDPFGQEIITSFIRYSNFLFSIVQGSERLLLRIHSGPRSLRVFIGELTSVMNGDIGLSEMNVNIEAFVTMFRKIPNVRKVRVTQAVFHDVPMTESSTGRVLISSQRNAIDDFKQRLSGGRLDRVSISVHFQDFLVLPIEVSSRGSLKIDPQWEDFSLLDSMFFESRVFI